MNEEERAAYESLDADLKNCAEANEMLLQYYEDGQKHMFQCARGAKWCTRMVYAMCVLTILNWAATLVIKYL